MNDADADYELRRMFLGFGLAIAFLLLLYVARTLKIYFLGRRVDAVVAKVLKREFEGTNRRPQYSYVLAYTDAQGRRRLLHELQRAGIQEYRVGDHVVAFVQGERVAEILSRRRLLVSALVLGLTVAALMAGYHFLLGKKN